VTPPPPSPKAPQYVPVDVAFAVYAMWASLLLSSGFAVCEFFVVTSVLDPVVRILLLLSYFLTIRALPKKRLWARYLAVLVTLLFYAFLAFDADGLTHNDLWHMLLRAPIDVFVVTRLFKPSVALWLVEA
jgi:hypothetical protein